MNANYVKHPEFWSSDPLVKSLGGLHYNHPNFEDDRSLIDKLEHVFNLNVDLIDQAHPDLEMTGVDLIVTSGLEHRAVAYAPKGRRAILVEIGLLRAFWTRVATLAHTPQVLSVAFPLKLDSKPLWMSQDVESVPGTDDWPITQERLDYCFDIFFYMLEYLVLHELAHHMRGHFDLEINKSRITKIDESSIGQRSGKTELGDNTFLLQDLEFDADAHGLDLSISSMAVKFPIDTWEVENIVEWQFKLILAQLIVSQILDAEDKETSDYPPDRHPAPVYRAINYSNLLSRTLHRMMGGDWAPFRDMHDTAWSEAAMFARELGLAKGRWHNDEGVPFNTGDFLELEQRFFTASERLDRMIDDQTGG